MSGPVAQHGSERRPAEPEVGGSSPPGPALLLVFLLLFTVVPVKGQTPIFDAVIVRGDIYPDWLIASAYAVTHKMWVIHLTSYNEQDVLKMLEGLKSYKDRVQVLIVGAPNAVSLEFEGKLRSLGIMVSRIGGATRYDTSLLLAVNFWRDCEKIVLVNGLRVDQYMTALSLALKERAPIIFTKDGKPPEGFYQALEVHLKQVRGVIVVGDGLSGEDEGKLSSMGYSISKAEGNHEIRIVETWSWQYTLRNIVNPYSLAIGLLIGIVAGYALSRARSRPQPKMDISEFLTVDERKVVDLIRERGELTQDELPELTGFSKPKISRLIKDLVDRNVVTRKKSGKTYVIRLSDRFVEVAGEGE